MEKNTSSLVDFCHLKPKPHHNLSSHLGPREEH
jgi:hypothetical protein